MRWNKQAHAKPLAKRLLRLGRNLDIYWGFDGLIVVREKRVSLWLMACRPAVIADHQA
jgi:hypothetical protein